MSFILWLIVGGLLGWVASMIMGTNDTQGKFLNIVVGIVGAFLGGLLLAPLFEHGHHQSGRFQRRLPDRLTVGRGDTAGHRRLLPSTAPHVGPRLSLTRDIGRLLRSGRSQPACSITRHWYRAGLSLARGIDPRS